MESVCQGDDALLGICFGFGVQNSLNFARKVQIQKYLQWQGTPPWKFEKINLSNEQKKFLGLRNFCMMKNFSVPTCTPLHTISPAPEFISLEKEIDHVRQVLQPNTSWIVDEIASVQIPQFLCDPTSHETKTLLKNYTQQQQQLNAILCSENLLEQVLEKLTEG